MTSTLDLALFTLLNGQARHPFLDAALPLFSDAWLLWAAAALFLGGYIVYCRRHYGEALWRVLVLVLLLGLSAGVADMSCNVIKDQVGRYRPFQTVVGAHFFSPQREWTVIETPYHAPGTIGGSFPSSHAATSMAVAMVLSLLFRRANPWIFALPLLVGWSRIYVAKHFPLDVFAGWCVGLLAVLVVWWACHLIFRGFIRHRRT